MYVCMYVRTHVRTYVYVCAYIHIIYIYMGGGGVLVGGCCAVVWFGVLSVHVHVYSAVTYTCMFL